MKLLNPNDIKTISGGLLLDKAQWSTVFGLTTKAGVDQSMANYIKNNPDSFFAKNREIASMVSAALGLITGYATYNYLVKPGL